MRRLAEALNSTICWANAFYCFIDGMKKIQSGCTNNVTLCREHMRVFRYPLSFPWLPLISPCHAHVVQAAATLAAATLYFRPLSLSQCLSRRASHFFPPAILVAQS